MLTKWLLCDHCFVTCKVRDEPFPGFRWDDTTKGTQIAKQSVEPWRKETYYAAKKKKKKLSKRANCK